MEVVVDLDSVVVTFAGIEEVDQIDLRVAAPATASGLDPAAVHRLGDVLAATDVGRLEPGPEMRVWINPVAVRFHAAGQVGPGWDERLGSRCATTGPAGGAPGWLEATVRWPDGA